VVPLDENYVSVDVSADVTVLFVVDGVNPLTARRFGDAR
jgi:hypothetical protein